MKRLDHMANNNLCIREQANPVQIEKCRELLAVGQGAFGQLSGILALAGNGVRLKILYLLEEEGELCPCDLSDILDMSIPAVSQHLRKLKDGNIIHFRKAGQTIFYFLKPEHLKMLRSFFKYIKELNEEIELV